MANINTAVINTPPGLGERELVEDVSFVTRPWLQHSYLPPNPCATLPHHWAELKSSILSNMLVHDNIKQPLVTFETNILVAIYNALPGNYPMGSDKLHQDFQYFVSLLAKATPKYLYDGYPVAQAQLFANQPQLAANDVFLLFNLCEINT